MSDQVGMMSAFSTDGRLDRAAFLRVAAPCLLLAVVTTALLVDVVERLLRGYVPEMVVPMALFATSLIPLWPRMIRRLHDTGRPGASVRWCLGLFMVGFVAFALLGICDAQAACRTHSAHMIAGFFLIYLGGFWVITLPVALFFVALGTCLLPSQPGPNRYGSPPSEVTP